MVNIVDLSRRRGAIVHLLPQVYELMKKNYAELPHIIFWKKEMDKKIIDINRRWVFALEGTKIVKGLLFYNISRDRKTVYVDSLIAAGIVFNELLIKFEYDDAVKSAEAFYISRDIKNEANTEMLKNVGLQDESVFNDEGYQLIGGLTDVLQVLKIRYAV